MIETAFPLPIRSKVWTLEKLEDPAMLAYFERATARRLHRSHLLSRHPYCAYCGNRVSKKKSTLDHLLPISKGGTDDPENLVLACLRCNGCKGNRTPEEWAADILAAGEVGP